MDCVFEWNVLELDVWRSKYSSIHRANLLQSYDYARGMCAFRSQKARWGVIKIDSVEAGMFQILEAGVFGNAIHAVILDRAPLWFDGFGTDEHYQAFFKTFAKFFPRRIGRKRRVVPEVIDSNKLRNIMKDLGYKRVDHPGYETIWIDLCPDEEVLRARLKGNWRNKLKKAEKSGLKIEWDYKKEYLSWLLSVYKADMAYKAYDGPSVDLMGSLGKASVDGDMLIGRAMLDGKVVAAILTMCHGSAATYQIGWASKAGRDNAAHSLLLWQCMCYLKKNGIKDFDLGGTNNEGAKNVKKFKEGINGETVTLIGMYR